MTPHYAVTVAHTARNERHTYLVPADSDSSAYWAVMGPASDGDFAERIEEV